MRYAGWIQILVFGAFLCSRAGAVGIPRFRVGDLVSSSDLIVLADVRQVRDLGPTQPIKFRNQLLPAEAYSADLLVHKTLKGQALDKVSVTYSLPLTFVGYSGLKPGARMVFLRRNDDQYGLADPYYSNFPAALEPLGESYPSADPSELVLSNLLAVFTSPTASNSHKYEVLRVDYALPTNENTIAALRKGLENSADRELNERLLGELHSFLAT